MTNATWKKRVLSHMLQERVTFAFDGVVAQIINSWQARRSHRLPPSFFSLHLCFLPLCRSPPTPTRSSLLAQWISLAGSVLLSGSRWGWLLMSNWARTWTARADNRKEGILEDSTKATAALFYLSLFPFLPNACDRLEEGWKEGPRPVTNIGHLYPDEPPRLCLWVMSVLLMIASLINSV